MSQPTNCAVASPEAGPCVHLVDDEQSVRDALVFLLQSHGLDVRAYASGPEFLAAFAAVPVRGCEACRIR